MERSTKPSHASALRVPSHGPDAHGLTLKVTPESAGWDYVGFDVLRVDGLLERAEGGREACVVVLSGRFDLMGLGEGGRESVFDGPPVALYVPPQEPWWVEGRGEIAVCTAPAEQGLEPRLLDAPRLLTRGSGGEERRIANILMEDEPAESLLVTEALTPAGHWSSYPPHRHDRDDPPHEALLEETYYHRLRPADGFAFQRVYTDDRSLDESIAVGDGDCVLVPRGYHPVAAGPRHDLYYLNVMAGPVRAWRTTVDPAFA
ncbi:MAG: 5-deoxy-glucuronate isomerase [Gaiellaceae bacterium]